MTNGIPVRLPTTNIGFDEAYYLQANPDVATLVQQGVFPSGRAHYEELGRLQGREPLRGGNYGRTLPLGIQRWRQSLGSSGPLVPSEPDEEEDDTFIPTTPAQTPAGGPQRVVDGGGGSGGGGPGDSGYSPDMAGTRSATDLGLSPGSLTTAIGAGLGALIGGFPGMAVSAAGRGLGAMEAARAANETLSQRGLSGIAPDVTVGLGHALPGWLGKMFGVVPVAEQMAAIESGYGGVTNDGRASGAAQGERGYGDDTSGMPGNPASLEAAALASYQDTTNANPGGGSVGSEGPGGGAGGFGGGYGGDSPDSGNGDPSGGREANGGHIRKDNRFAAGGLNQAVPQNVAPWDRINVDTDLRGLTSASAYQSSPGDDMYAGYRSGGLTGHVEPSRNPVHAALGTQVQGPGTGRSDHIPAYLSNDEYVIPADVVAALGDGSSNAGAKKLRELVVTTRDKYRKKLGRLPPPKE